MDDLDSLLAEADALLRDLPSTRPQPAVPGPSRIQRCHRLLLVPAGHRLGRNTSLEPARGCDALRCTACDLRVLTFEDGAWGEQAEYLFFRNSHPHGEKLRAALERRPGARAYCCQCRWETVEKRMEAPRSWVCGKH